MEEVPFVSVCTPTFNRRPFITSLVRCFQQQTYPADRMELIILDDGTDPVGDMVEGIPHVKYFYHPTKMPLGQKRNELHRKCSGDILVYMDDDDYYPPTRVAHAVSELQRHPSALLAGCSEMHLYFGEPECRVYQCGPYKENHSTAATFAFRKQLLDTTQYADNDELAEEVAFTKRHSIPMIQLDPRQTILVFAHAHNSLNKNLMLERKEQMRMVVSPFGVDDFVADPLLKYFYLHQMSLLLREYTPGQCKYKPGMQAAVTRQLGKMGIAVSSSMNSSSHPSSEVEELRRKLSEKDILLQKVLLQMKQLVARWKEP
jgi:glycosyltransferase involved in cell wall biosynthesis